MARKQKKLTRKERTQQQQALTERQRQAKGWISPNEKAKRRQELIEDMAPLMAMVETGAGSADENLFWLLADSGDLAEEPEFKEVFTEPLVTLPTYISVAESLGVATPDIMDELPEEEQADKKAEILEETTRRLLTNELRREIIEAVDRLRLRWKKEEKRAEAARAAGLQLTLNDRKSTAIWPMIGLVQAIVLRSLGAGFELVGVTMDEEEDDANDDESLADLYEKLQDPGVDKKLEQAIKKVPGLQNYLEKQLDKIWEEGETAIFTGDLYLELFTDEELEAGVEIFKAVLSAETTDENAPSEGPAEASIPQKSRNLFSQLDLYLAQQFTPERLEQLRTRLRTVLDEADYPAKYFSFVKMLADAMADEEAAENEKGFLLRALLGEIRAVSVMEDEEAEEAGDE
ncbi:MAG: hypothetical protein HS126_17970 [Anaerolineales bacterium]|nr:hypothetical protein [Anaerolineales bacterium]